MRPALSKKLVRETALFILVFRVFRQIDQLNEVLPVPQTLHREVYAALEDLLATFCEFFVVHFPGHLRAGIERGQVE
jgi:hypothetical protein